MRLDPGADAIGLVPRFAALTLAPLSQALLSWGHSSLHIPKFKERGKKEKFPPVVLIQIPGMHFWVAHSSSAGLSATFRSIYQMGYHGGRNKSLY